MSILRDIDEVGEKMSFSEKDCKKIREIYVATFDRSRLAPEDLEFALEWTMGDLIAHACFTLEEARTFRNFLKIEKKRQAAPGFTIGTPDGVVNESRGYIVECDSMCRMAGLSDSFGTPDADPYHPIDNASGGVRFEDHGAGEQAGMIKSNLYSIFTKAQSLHDSIGDTDELPEWVQEKIAVADEMIDTISDYLGYEYKRKGSM